MLSSPTAKEKHAGSEKRRRTAEHGSPGERSTDGLLFTVTGKRNMQTLSCTSGPFTLLRY